MNTILLATDLSPRSDRAFGRAMQLAGQVGGRLVILHVIDDELPEPAIEGLRAHAERDLAVQTADRGESRPADVQVQTLLGQPAPTILAQAGSLPADIIVLGTHRAQSLDLFRGTTVERVVRLGDCPVLVVRNRTSGPYARVMVAVDFSIHSRRAAEFAIRNWPQAEVHLVHAYDVPFKGFQFGAETHREVREAERISLARLIEGELAAAVTQLGGAPRKLTPVLRQGTAREVIWQEFERLTPDLVVVGTHGRTGVSRALLGSVAEDLLCDLPCDTLAVRAW